VAVKIVRQANQIALIGAPTSAAAHSSGLERAPERLRAAGLVERLSAAGFQVTDLGDIPPQLFQEDEESPRARNIGPVVAALEALRPRVEQAFKSGALPVVLGGDDTIALATLAGVRRYLRAASLLYFDSDADLNTPATTPTGRLDGMVVAHIIGRGAPELVRFWSEPPLAREPEVVLFGLERLDPGEREFLERSMIRRYPAAEIHRLGASAAAEAALRSLHAARTDFVLHLDVDILSSEDFSACNFPGTGGLRLEQVRQALEICASAKTMAALDLCEYNPERDADGQGAKLLVELLVAVLSARLAALTAPPVPAAAPAEEPAVPAGGLEKAAAPETSAPAEAQAAPTQPEKIEDLPQEVQNIGEPAVTESEPSNAAEPPAEKNSAAG
jgi:arginase